MQALLEQSSFVPSLRMVSFSPQSCKAPKAAKSIQLEPLWAYATTGWVADSALRSLNILRGKKFPKHFDQVL